MDLTLKNNNILHLGHISHSHQQTSIQLSTSTGHLKLKKIMAQKTWEKKQRRLQHQYLRNLQKERILKISAPGSSRLRVAEAISTPGSSRLKEAEAISSIALSRLEETETISTLISSGLEKSLIEASKTVTSANTDYQPSEIQ